ncbi:hypothetical protein N7462_002535 [Penicillium macrosclerotiorum]|uniref:uncharacterized protein n=1 Tax=Penicillium macrosclerotiorum TaxID=303699 RepID=UPI0025466F6A|nr:uncharacterized protein N7462_002535 [Penicillium macrosclerotiorum]KAJ5693112.1 hypothetical protein N7462_002535 [Penicillium macrosclerotiorum]
MLSATYVAIVGVLIGWYLVKRRKSTSALPLPPGPTPLPLIGNAHQAPKSYGWRTYQQWSEKYGPIVHVNMLGQHIVILSKSELAHELLSKRGPIMSDRPHLFLATELALKGFNLLMMNYTDQFKKHQRLQASVLNATPAGSYIPLQEMESKQLLLELMESDGKNDTYFQGNFQRLTASIVHTLLYGFRIKDFNDPILLDVVKLNEEFGWFVQPGAHLVDIFPVLNNLPSFLAPWKAKAENHYTTKSTLRDKNFRRALSSNSWNISKHFKKMVEKDKVEMPTHELAFELGTIIDAALDTTTDSLIWFVVICITQDKHFIAKARKELDAHVGRGRLPVQDDKPHLPYISAIVEELFRFRPAAPEGAPHVSTEEVTFHGYTIPKGSIILPVIWTILREEAIFGPRPDDFIPDRWLCEDGQTLRNFPQGFGYGRRTCPGRHFARNIIWLVVARLLWSFDIEAGLSETGEPTVVDPEACSYGIVMRALPFKASFKPRGPWVRDVIAENGDTYKDDHEAILDQIGAEFARL